MGLWQASTGESQKWPLEFYSNKAKVDSLALKKLNLVETWFPNQMDINPLKWIENLSDDEQIKFI